MVESLRAHQGKGLVTFLFIVIVLAAVGGAGYFYLTSPEYLAQQNIKKADDFVAKKQYGQAAELYLDIAKGYTALKEDASKKLSQLAKPEILQQASAESAAKLIPALSYVAGEIKLDLFKTGLGLVNKHKAADPLSAKQIFNAINDLRKPNKQLAALRLELLEAVAKKHPGNVDNAVELAQEYELQRRWDEIEPVLVPVKNQLADSEGARILGQLYTGQGKIDEAYQLLQPYTAKRLTRYLDAEKQYNDTLNKIYNKAIDDLNNGLASPSFYTKYDKADKDTQNLMVQNFVRERLDADVSFKAYSQAYQEAASIVPVALDLGIVMLRKAQNEQDVVKRNAQLENAEKTFLSIKGAVGDTDEYKLYLGQVYYWLGKYAEGEQQFDSLLAANKRSFSIMMAVATSLREVGETSKARDIAEEAYTKTRVTAEKYGAAQLRALMPIDTDDKIKWLSKADKTNAHIQATLFSAKGEKAEEKFQYKKAAKFYRDAVAAFLKQPETSSTLNNTALVYLSLYRVTRDKQALNKGLDLFDRAVALSPSSGITLWNAASYMISIGFADAVQDKIDLKLLSTIGSDAYLSFCYTDEKGKAKYVNQISKNQSINRGMAYMERVMLLMPKQSEGYEAAYRVYRLTKDYDGLNQVVDKLKSVDLDLAAAKEKTDRYYSGKDDKKYLDRTNQSIQHSSRLLKKVNANTDPVTYAVVLSQTIDGYMSLSRMGKNINGEKLQSMANKLYRTSPSSSTRSTLIEVLLFNASKQFAKGNNTYKSMVKRSGRALSDKELITIALDNNVLTASAVLKNKYFKKAQEWIIVSDKKFPSSPSVSDWALLRHTDVAYAKALKKRLMASKNRAIDDAFVEKLNTASVSAAYSLAWSSEVEGNTEKAQQYLAKAEQDGHLVALPKQTKK